MRNGISVLVMAVAVIGIGLALMHAPVVHSESESKKGAEASPPPQPQDRHTLKVTVNGLDSQDGVKEVGVRDIDPSNPGNSPDYHPDVVHESKPTAKFSDLGPRRRHHVSADLPGGRRFVVLDANITPGKPANKETTYIIGPKGNWSDLETSEDALRVEELKITARDNQCGGKDGVRVDIMSLESATVHTDTTSGGGVATFSDIDQGIWNIAIYSGNKSCSYMVYLENGCIYSIESDCIFPPN